MKWIPKGCEVSNCKEKSNGPKFVRGPNLATWNLLCRKTKEKGGTESSDQVLEEKDIIEAESMLCKRPQQWKEASWS